MKKQGVVWIIFSFALLFLSLFFVANVSAFSFLDLFNKFTGHVINDSCDKFYNGFPIEGSCCGDSICVSPPENGDNCVVDCSSDSACGNRLCEPDNGGEDCLTCPVDCGSCLTQCGDGSCDTGETCSSCSDDCGSCPVCGDGTCNGVETCFSCSQDCGDCSEESCTDGILNQDETGVDCGGNYCEPCGEECSPSLSNVKIYLDPSYVSQRKKTENYVGDKMSPFDDIICDVILDNPSTSSGESCNVPTINGKLLTMSNPDADPSQDSNWDVELKTGTFTSSTIVGSSEHFTWQIKGYGKQFGWADSSYNLGLLVNSSKLKCVAYISDDSEKKSETTNPEPPYTNCVSLTNFRNSKFPIVVAYAQSYSSPNLVPSEPLSGGYEVANLFGSIQPFKSYTSSFSFYVDLKPVEDLNGVFVLGPESGGKYVFSSDATDVASFPNKVLSGSSCGSDKSVILLNKRTNCGYSDHSGRFIAWSNEGSSNCRRMGWHGIIHEFGHNFCGLGDEYEKTFNTNRLTRLIGSGVFGDYIALKEGHAKQRNCVVISNVPILFYEAFDSATILLGYNSGVHFLNGKNLLPSLWGEYGENFAGCEASRRSFRPSEKSFMNNYAFFTPEFNVVSCGYCLATITGQKDMITNYKTCMDMAGVIKPSPKIVPDMATIPLGETRVGNVRLIKHGRFDAEDKPTDTIQQKENNKQATSLLNDVWGWFFSKRENSKPKIIQNYDDAKQDSSKRSFRNEI